MRQAVLIEQQTLDEQALIQRAKEDTAHFAPLYEAYFERIYAYCLRRVDTEQEAEDLTSTVFIKALRGLEGYRGGHVAAWLFRIAHNELVNYWRSQRPQISLDAHEIDVPTGAEPPGAALAMEQEAALLRKLVAKLPEDQQNLLALKLAGQLTSEQIGEVVGKSASAVRVELHRIMKLLRVLYEEAMDA